MHMSYKTIDGLMRHLRSNGIAFSSAMEYNISTNWGMCSSGRILERAGEIRLSFL